MELTRRIKVLAGVAAMMAVFLTTAIVASSHLAGMAGDAAEMRKTSFQSVQILGQVQFDMMRYRQIEAARTLARSLVAGQTEATTLARLQAQIDEGLKRYRLLAVSDEERSRADRIIKNWGAYLALDPKLRDMPAEGTPDSASTFYTGEMRTLFNELVGDLDLTVKSETEAARKTEDASAILYSKQWAITIGAMLSVLALAAANVLSAGSRSQS